MDFSELKVSLNPLVNHHSLYIKKWTFGRYTIPHFQTHPHEYVSNTNCFYDVSCTLPSKRLRCVNQGTEAEQRPKPSGHQYEPLRKPGLHFL